jgi:tetratricopeptide (TPR) repeat protein
VVRGLVGVGIEVGERQVGVSRQLVSRWERGITCPRAPYPKLLCLLFQATAEQLGLVSPFRRPSAPVTIEGHTIEDGDVERRAFLRLAVTAPLGMALPSIAHPLPSLGSLQAISAVVDEYRRTEDWIPSHLLLSPILAHLEHVHLLIEQFGWSRELAATAANTALLAAWFAFDLRDNRSAGEHHRAAVAYAHRAGNPVLEAYMAGHMGYWASDVGLIAEAQRSLGHAHDLAPAPAQARLAVLEAWIHAKDHNKTECLRSLGRAEGAIGLDDDPLWPEGFPFDEMRVTRYRGGCAAELGLADAALPALERALVAAPSGRSKLRGRILENLARAHVHGGEIDEACRLTGEAFDVAVGMAYPRLLGRVQEVRRGFPPSWKGNQAVTELDERILAGWLGGS